MTEGEARQRLDAYYAETLGVPLEVFGKSGIDLLPLEHRPSSTSLFRNAALIVHAPTPANGLRPCVVVAHPQLLEPLWRFLPGLTVERLFEAATLEQLTRLVYAEFPGASISPGGLLIIARFVSPETFKPFQGPERAHVRRLDEHNLANLALLSRYGRGIYALCDARSQILSRAGVRDESRYVSEIGVRTEAEALRGRGLAKTVVTAATEAILAAGRVPLYVHSATNEASQKVALALGYQPYADELIWFLPG
ncbi:MAG TPA: GNAT family N-acetyltransferase [Ktedonobacterales bacterium]|nr:GNAT family N-acetyltransferase [Ktedonobacterales bacterium]